MKKYFSLALLMLTSVALFAQKPLEGNKISDNWSLGINLGGVTPLKHSAFFPNMRPTFGLELGKQVTPILGISLEGMTSINTSASATALDHSNVSLLGRINLSNAFGSYLGAPRPFEVEAVTGFGWLHGYKNGHGDYNDLSYKVGLNFNFNLGENNPWSIAVKPALVYNLEGDAPAHGVRFNANNAVVELTAGVTYHFSNSNGKRHMSYFDGYDQAEIDRLNARINGLRSDLQDQENQCNKAKQAHDSAMDAANRKINDLQNALDDCNKKKASTGEKVEAYVSFRQGSAGIDATQLANIDRIGTYLQKNTDAKVTIKGYASPEGGKAINNKLAAKRAEAVKSVLVSKYKINANRIDAQGQGVGSIFGEPNWNRISICTID